MTVKKGDHIRYTGKYAWEQPEIFGPVDRFPPYPPGTVIGFRNQGETVTVRLDREGNSVDWTYADWPVNEVEKVV